MKRSIYLTFLLIIWQLNISLAQENLSSLWKMTPCNHLPCEMAPVKKWIDKVMDPLFISSLQYSSSRGGDNTFLSFFLLGKPSLSIPLPNTGGVELRFANTVPPRFRSQQVRVEFTKQILSYRVRAGFKDWGMTNKNYFFAATDVLRLAGREVLANVLNREIETQDYKSSKIKILLDSVNKKMKTKLVVSEKSLDDLNSFSQEFINYFGNEGTEAIYKTFIQQKDSVKTQKKMTEFYAGTGFFPEGVKAKIDDMNQPKFALGMTTSETIIFPKTILNPVDLADSSVNFNFRFIKGNLDYERNSLQIIFEGSFPQQFTMTNAKQYDFDRSKDTFVLNPAQYNPASDGKITEIILTVSPTITTIDAKTLFGKKFLLSKNIHHVATPKKSVKKATPAKRKKKA